MTGLVPKAVTSQVASSLCSSLHFAGSFEIELNGQLIFSKIELGGFPHEDDVSEMMRECKSVITAVKCDVARQVLRLGCILFTCHFLVLLVLLLPGACTFFYAINNNVWFGLV